MRINRSIAPALLPVALTFTLTAACNSDEGKAGAGPSASQPAATPSPTPTPTPTANGVQKLTGPKIFSRARKETKAVKSLHIRGLITVGKQKIVVDMRYAGSTSATGDITVNGQKASITRIGSAVYLQGNARLMTAVAGKGAAKLFEGKYLKFPPSYPGFAELASFANLSKTLSELLTPSGTVTKGRTARIDGVPVIALSDGGPGTLYVSTVDEPYVLRLDGGRGNRLDFVEHNLPVKVQRPPADQVVDVRDFKKPEGT